MQNYNNGYDFYQKPSFPTSVKVICILEFVFKGLSLLFSTMGLMGGAFLSVSYMNVGRTVNYSFFSVVMRLIACVIVIVSAILILNRKKVGIWLYYGGYAIIFILTVISYIPLMSNTFITNDATRIGYTLGVIIGVILGIIMLLILPILMSVFVFKNKEIFE